MNKSYITAILAVTSLSFSTGALAQSMSKSEYKATEKSIEADFKSAQSDCDSFTDNARNICMAVAKGKQKVAKTELEARYKPSKEAGYKVSVAKAEADYAVAKEKCDDKVSNDKKVCVKEAKSAEMRAKVAARAHMNISDASKPAKEKSTAATSMQERAGIYSDDSVITTRAREAVL